MSLTVDRVLKGGQREEPHRGQSDGLSESVSRLRHRVCDHHRLSLDDAVLHARQLQLRPCITQHTAQGAGYWPVILSAVTAHSAATVPLRSQSRHSHSGAVHIHGTPAVHTLTHSVFDSLSAMPACQISALSQYRQSGAARRSGKNVRNWQHKHFEIGIRAMLTTRNIIT